MTADSPSIDLRLLDGPVTAPATLLLAHGAGAPIDSPFMGAIASGLAQRGWRVVRFPFPYMARMQSCGRRQAPDRMPVLQECFRDQVRLEREQSAEQPLVIGGKSLGGRVASLLADELASDFGVLGCLCLGYPFHPPGRPLQLRTEHLATLQTPTLILQGERDSFGRPDEVQSYTLSPQVRVEWLPGGDHSFKPTRSSNLSEAENWATAVAGADAFLRNILRDIQQDILTDIQRDS